MGSAAAHRSAPKLPATILAMLLVGTSALAHATSVPAGVTVLEVEPSLYTQAGDPSADARMLVASRFFQRNSDSYDFLVVFPAFDSSFSTQSGPHAVGLHSGVRNGVKGIGHSEFDNGLAYGSQQRLKGYIDIGTLRPGSPTSTVPQALETLAHEVAHQWSGRAGGNIGILGQEGVHWSFFLSSSASVLYGSEWRDNKDGTFTAVASRRRYSPLDLYLMGFLASEEVPSFQLLTPEPGSGFQSTDIPPLDGTRIRATASTFALANITSVLGPRQPTVAQSQRDLRASFILLVPPGVAPTPEQLAHVEQVRAAWANQFFFLTRGRALMQTERVDRTPTPVSTSPSVNAGLQYLLARQGVDGNWADHPETSIRETEAALAALALFDGAQVDEAMGRAAVRLTNLVPVDNDGRARRLRALAVALQSDAAGLEVLEKKADPLGIWQGGGRGYESGYGSTVLDTALVGLALSEGQETPEALLAGFEAYLLARQNGDGGWPALEHGPSRVETTALVLQFLARRPRTDGVVLAAGAAFAYLTAHRGLDGLFMDDLDLPSTTAEVILALAAWGQLGSWDGSLFVDALLARQLEDGSWEGSAYQTAQALRALRRLLVPNLFVSTVTLSAAAVPEGEGASVQVLVHNNGFAASGEVLVQAFDAEGKPFGAPQRMTSLAPGEQRSVQLLLDTRGHGGSDKLFVVVDPEGAVDETREDDNRVAKDFLVESAPAGAELFVSSGSVVASPARVGRVPQPTTVTAVVGNAGLTAVSGVTVSLAIGGTVVQSTLVDLPAQTTVPVSFPVNIQGGPYPVQLQVRVDPYDTVAEAREDNNVAALSLPADATVDLRMASVVLMPASVEQGQDVAITFNVYNAGTTEATNASVRVSVMGADGSILATLPPATLSIASGVMGQGQVLWRASHAGTHTVVVKAVHPGEAMSGDESGTASLIVNPSSLPNLTLGVDAISTSPSPPLVGQSVTALAKVRNIGAAAGPFAVDFFLGNPEAGGKLLGRVPVSGLGSGATTSVSVSFTPESSAKQSLVVRVDPETQVAEFDESDNTALLAIEPLPIADLLLTDADILPDDAFPQAGDTVSVTVSVYNQGRQPSSATQLDLYLGAPESGGKKIGSAPLGALEGLSRGEVDIAWSTTGLSGPQRLVAVVNASGVSPEQRTDNNRGERQVLIQSGALSLSEPFFSPNNDGVKDSTQLFYQLPAPGPSVVYVSALDGKQLRTLEAPDTGAAFGSVTWDGRDDAGKVVKDGEYRLTAIAGATGEQGQIGTVLAVVDTNLFPIEDVEDPELLRPVFPTMNLPQGALPGERLAMPDDSGIYYFNYYGGYPSDGQSPKPCGFYYQSLLGGEPELLTPTTWDCHYNPPRRYAISPDGRYIAYIRKSSAPPLPYTGFVPYVLELYSRDTREFVTLTQGSSTDWSNQLTNGTVWFSPDSQRVWFIRGEWQYLSLWENEAIGTAIVSLGVDARNQVPRHEFHIGGMKRFKLSSDLSSALVDSCSYDFVFDGGEWKPAVYCDGARLVSPSKEYPYQELVSGRHGDSDWVFDGERVLVSERGGFWTEDGNRQSTRLYACRLGWGVPKCRDWNGDEQFPVVLDDDSSLTISVAASPYRDAAVYAFSAGSSSLPEGAIGLLKPIVGSTPKVFARSPGVKGMKALDWSPRGTFLYGQAYVPEGQSNSLRDWALVNLINLSARIQAARPPGSTTISFRGTATDRNFESYTIAIRPFGSSTAPVVIARRQQPVFESVLATWTPPGPGLYEAVLTVRDKAGNVASRSTRAAWSNAVAIADLSVEPTFISPNGDLSQDQAVVRYQATSPITTRFSVANASGQVVRAFDRTHLEAEQSSIVWDGRDEAGAQVADGDYTISAERVSAGMVVDTVAPTTQLVLGARIPNVNEQVPVFDFHEATAYTAAGGVVGIPSVKAWVSWKTADPHLDGWQFEALSGADSSVLERGSASSEQNRSLAVEEVRGTQLRLRARDHAGNTGLSAELALPERLFLVGIGEASTLEADGSLRYGGRILPRIDLLSPVQNKALVDSEGSINNYTMVPSSFAFTPQRYAFALANTVGVPIVSYAVAYPSPVTGTEIVDHEGVKMLAEDAILWDARSLPERPFTLKILGTDAKGRVFTIHVPFDTRAQLESCVGYQSEEQVSVLTRIARGAPGGEMLAPGAVLEFTPAGSATPVLTQQINLAGKDITADSISYSTTFASGSLTQCKYRITARGQRLDGSEVEGTSFLDICGMHNLGAHADGSVLMLSLAETFRQPVQSVEVHLREGASDPWHFAAVIPGFAGGTQAPIPTLGCKGQVRLVAHLADGRMVDSTTQHEQGFRACREEPEPQCADIDIVANRHADAPLCSAQEALYDVGISAKTTVTGGWKKIEAALVTPMGAPVAALPLTFSQTPEATLATASMATGALPEGEYRVQVEATDATGTLFRKSSDLKNAVFVDRTPVQLAISAPVPGEHFCAEEQLRPDGTQGGHFDFRGFISDDWLEFATVKLRRVGDTSFTDLEFFESGTPRRVMMDGVLKSVDASQLLPGTYEFSVHVRDASGGACLATRTFYVNDSIGVEGLTVEPGVFVPNGGAGTANATRVDYILDGNGNVGLTAIDKDGNTWVLNEVAGQTSGPKSFLWHGNAVGKPQLPDGNYTLRVEATDTCGRKASRAVRVVLDTLAPVARIEAPTSGSSVGTLIQIMGEASDPNFKHYELLLGQGLAPTELNPIASSGSPKKGLLGTVSTAGLEPGDYTIALVVEDQAGLRSEARVSVRVVAGDLVAGFDVTPHLVSPNGDMKKDTAVATIALHRPAEKVELRLVGTDGAPVKTLLVQSSLGSGGTELTLPPATLENLPDGSYSVQLLATAGAITETALAPLSLDVTLPTITVTSPAADGFLAGRGDVVGTITDAHLTVWHIIQKDPTGEVELANGNAPEIGTLAYLEGLSEGKHLLVLTAEDGAGNVRSVSVELTSDTTSPKLAFIQPLANDFLNGELGSVEISANLVESNLSVVKLELERDGAATRQLYSTTSVPGTTVRAPWSLASEPDGAVRLVWTAIDRAGNQASARIPVVVDKTVPVAHLLAPRDTYLTGSGQFRGTASDANLDSYTLEIASGPMGSASSFNVIATGKVSVQGGVLAELPVLPADGVYTARLTVRDLAGNTQEDQSSFVVDTRPPAAPLALTSSVLPQRNIQLSWTASSDPDVVGYRLLRGSDTGALTRVGSVLITSTSKEDILPADGTYRYVVVAVDAAGLESEYSNEVSVDVDLSPPMASITRPTAGASVGGVMEVLGSAFAVDDFKEYRLSLGEGAEPTTFTPVMMSPAIVSHGSLGTVDLSMKPQGSVQTIRLEVEDFDGNVAKVQVSVKVDNVAPTRPVLVSATPSGADVAVVWKANTDTDLAGYLLFRNGVPVNLPSGSSLEDLSRYLLPSTSTNYLDKAVPDGDVTYELLAMDLAGNLSERSQPVVLHLDRYAPAAQIVSPVSLSRLSETVTLVAEVNDLDVAKVQFEVRGGSETSFQPLGSVLTRYPYTVAFNPAVYGPAAVEVRAVATDRSGKVDANPVSSYFFRDAPPLAPVPTFTAKAYKVTLGWSAPNPAGSVAGHVVKRASSSVGSSYGPRPTGTASASSTGAGSAAGAYDESGSTYWVSAGSAPQRWELQLSTPMLVQQISASYPYNQSSTNGAKADLLVRVRGLWVVLARGVSPSDTVPVNPPLEVEAVAYAFTSSPSGKVGLDGVTLQTVPLVPGPTLDDPSSLYGSVVYTVSAVTPFGLSTGGTVTATTYSPYLDALPGVVPTPSVLVSGTNAPPGSTIEVLRGNEVVTQGTANVQGKFAVETPLLAGENVLYARARYGVDSISADTSTRVVRYQLPPQVDILLALSGQSGANATFAFTVSGDTATVTRYEVRRAFGTDITTIAQLSSSERSFSQTSLRNGLYRYSVVAVDAQGFESVPSNTVELTVDVLPPGAPADLVVTAPPVGGRLDLTWSAVPGGSGYLIERALSASGPFEGIGLGTPITVAFYADLGIQNGSPYYYRVFAVDEYGNRSAPSQVSSGTPREDVAPEAPRLLAPTRPGQPLLVTSASTGVSGMAEPGAIVELFGNGRSIGTTIAGPSEVLYTELPLAHGSNTGYSLSDDGKTAIYSFTLEGSGGYAIAVEDIKTHEVRVLTHPDVQYFNGTPVLSPDKRRVAVTARRRSDSKMTVLIGDVASGTWKQVNASRPNDVDSLAWSTDSARIAYVSYDTSWHPILAVSSVETGVEQIVWSDSSADDLYAPTWVGPNQLLGIVSPYTWGRPWKILEWTLEPSVSTRELFSAQYIDRPLVVSPSRTRLLMSASSNWIYDVYLINLVSGELRKLTQNAEASYPVFSPDETRIAYLDSWELTLLDLGSGAKTPLGNISDFPDSLLWTADGLVFVKDWSFPQLVDWGASFEFSDVELGRGTNRFVAFSTDASGNRSSGSQPIEVVLDVAGQPDLTVSAVVQPAMPLAGHPANAVVTVKNVGGGAASGVELAVSVLGSDGSTRASSPVTLSGSLAPGAFSTVLVPIDLSGLSGGQELAAVVDPRQLIQDSERGNNQAVVPFTVLASTELAVAVQVSPADLNANGSGTATVMLVNPGPARELAVEVVLQDASGARVNALGPDELFSPLGSGAQTSFTRTFSASGLLAGDYEVVVRAKAGGTVVATAHAPAKILPDRSVTLALSTSRTRYGPGESIDLSARVESRSSNALLSGATLTLEVQGTGAIVFTKAFELPILALGASVTQGASLASGLAPGTYKATARVALGALTLATSESSFVVEGRPNLQGAVAVQGAAGDPPAIPFGSSTTVQFAVANSGTASAENVVVRLRVLEPVSLAVVSTEVMEVGSLAPGGNWSGSRLIPTAGLELRNYVVSLTAQRTGAAETPLATARFRVADSVVPLITSTNLTEGMFVRGAVSAELRVLDDHAGVGTVLASVDGAPPVPLELTGGTPLNGLWAARIPLGSDGTHQLRFSASDVEGNDGRVTPQPGNPIVLTVVSDTVRPQLTISGVFDVELYDAAITPVVEVSDTHLASAIVTLDGAPYTSGTPVEADGSHVLQVEAQDKAGNRSSAAVTFKVDRTAPIIAVSGVFDGEFRAGPFTPVVEVRDANLLAQSIVLDGQPFLSGTVVSVEGSHLLEVEASDAVGHSSRRTVAFTVDLTQPEVRIDGVTDGEVTSRDVVPVITAADAHLLAVETTLDGMPYTSGTPVTGEGEHLLRVVAVDRAGNRVENKVGFIIDKAGPVITITGVSEGAFYGDSVQLGITISDAHLDGSSRKLDGEPFTTDTRVAEAEGRHVLVVEARDRAGNSASKTVSFTIDKTPPRIVIGGVVAGGSYEDTVTPVVIITDDYLRTSSVLLDGMPFVSGTPVDSDGVHVLVAEAEDFAGHHTRSEVSFSVLQIKYQVVKRVPSGFIRALALLRGNTCELQASDVLRLSAFLETEVKLAGGMLQVVSNEQAFQEALRSGLFNLFILVSDGAPAAICSAMSTGDVKGQVREDNVRAMTERVFSGEAGLLVLRPRAADWPQFREALGVDVSGLEKSSSVVGWSGPFETVGNLSVLGRNVQLKLYGAVPAARYGHPLTGAVAVATYTFGAGRSVTFGFDPSQAMPSTEVSGAFQSALAWVQPTSGEFLPLGVAAVEIALENQSKQADTRVRELLAPALTALFTDPTGTLEPFGPTLEWRFVLDREGRVLLRYLVRLPDTVGTYETRTEVATMLPSGPRVFGNYNLTLEVHQTGESLLAEARAAAAALPVWGPEGSVRARIERALAQVQARPVFTAADAEANLADLFAAVDDARSLRTISPVPMRSALGRLIRYWEAQWSAL